MPDTDKSAQPEYPELTLLEVLPTAVHLAAETENGEIRCLAELARDMVFHILNLEGEIEALEERIVMLPCDSGADLDSDAECDFKKTDQTPP